MDQRAVQPRYSGNRSARAEQKTRKRSGPGANALAQFRHHCRTAAGNHQHLPHDQSRYAHRAPVKSRVQCPGAAPMRRLASRNALGIPASTNSIVPLSVPPYHIENATVRVFAADQSRCDWCTGESEYIVITNNMLILCFYILF